MSSEKGNIDTQATLQFGGIEYDIEINDENDVLVINVENTETLDQWTGKYDASCKLEKCSAMFTHCIKNTYFIVFFFFFFCLARYRRADT